MDSNEHDARHNGKSDKVGMVKGLPAENPLPKASFFHPDRIAKNTSYLTLALVIQKVFSLGYFIYISRALGETSIGHYLTALAITTVFSIFIDTGFSQVLIRETAKHRDQTQQLLSTTVAYKLGTSLLAYLAALSFVWLFHYPSLTISLVAIAGLVMVLDSFTLTFYSVFRGHQQLLYESIGTVINKIVVIIVGVTALSFGANVRYLILAILIGSVFNVLYTLVLLRKKLSINPRPFWDHEVFKKLGRVAIPFAIAGVFVTIYGYQDQVLLGNPALTGSRGPSYVAWYGTAYKLTFALQFIPAAVAAAIFPAMSAYFLNNRLLLTKTFQRAMFYLIILAVPLSLGIMALADRIILTAYSKAFEASIVPLQILILGLLFVFLNYPVGYLLNACDRQSRNTVHIGIVMVFNLILNLILIPRYTFIGAAIGSTISSVLLFFLGLSVVRQIVDYDRRFLFSTLWKSCLAGGSMAVSLFVLKPDWQLLALIPLGTIVYFGLLFLLRGFTLSDGTKIYRAVLRKII